MPRRKVRGSDMADFRTPATGKPDLGRRWVLVSATGLASILLGIGLAYWANFAQFTGYGLVLQLGLGLVILGFAALVVARLGAWLKAPDGQE